MASTNILETVTIPKEEYEELKRRAEVDGEFERR